MMTLSDQIKEELRKEGFRITQVRERLIEFILNQKGHWTIQDLIGLAQKEVSLSGQATLYRTVSLLAQMGVLTETRLGGGAARYEVSGGHHDHLTCLDCGKILEFENSKIEALQKSIAKKLGFHLLDHRMELFGKCAIKNCPSRSR